jgi:anti-sigma regulatory factor (Ser/Thr protein kinase)
LQGEEGPVTPPDVELALPADPESVAVARQVIRGVTDRYLWDDGRAGDIAIAVTEACTNAVLHAYPSGEGEYRVHVWAADERLVVSVVDEGDGIAPKVPSAKAGLGLGLPLMVAISDEASFARNDDGHNEVRLTFRREPVVEER